MYAVIKTGGKQYKVASGDIIQVEKLTGEVGDKVSLSEVLMIGGNQPKIGMPLVKDAVVSAEIVDQFRGEKVIIFKKKRRHNYRRKKGHRQYLTALRITSIALGADKLSEAAAKTAKKAAPTPEAKAEKPKAETKAKAPAKAKTETKAAKPKAPAAKKPKAKE